MKIDISYVNSYNRLGRSLFASKSPTKDQTLLKLENDPNKAKILAHLVKFRLYRKNKDIVKQNAELSNIRALLTDTLSNIKFSEIQEFVRNRNLLFQKQLPSHLDQAIIDLISKGGIKYRDFLFSLSPEAENFLVQNGILLTLNKYPFIVEDLDLWVNQARWSERRSRLGIKFRILEAYYNRLDTLDLSGIGAVTLPSGVFRGLIHLKYLYLSNNQINELPVEIFNGLSNLQLLDLSYNQLKHFPEGIFESVRKLRNLDLSNNQISELSAGIFDDLPDLQVLDLSHNQLKKLPDGASDKLKYLHMLWLSNDQTSRRSVNLFNGLHKIDFLSFMPYEIKLNILKYLSSKDQKYFRLINSTANHLVIDENNPLNPLPSLVSFQLDENIVIDKTKFNKFIKYLGSSYCGIKVLDLIRLKGAKEVFQKVALNKLLAGLTKNTSVIRLIMSSYMINENTITFVGEMLTFTKIKIEMTEFEKYPEKMNYLKSIYLNEFLPTGNKVRLSIIITIILNSALNFLEKIEFLRHEREFGLFIAIKEGDIKTVTSYTTAITNSDLPTKEQIYFLVGKTSKEEDELYKVLSKGNTETITYVSAILNSELSNEKKISILRSVKGVFKRQGEKCKKIVVEAFNEAILKSDLCDSGKGELFAMWIGGKVGVFF